MDMEPMPATSEREELLRQLACLKAKIAKHRSERPAGGSAWKSWHARMSRLMDAAHRANQRLRAIGKATEAK